MKTEARTAPLETETPLLEIADRAMEIVSKRLPPGCSAELFLSRGKERGIEMREGRLESVQQSSDEGVGLRVLQDGRMGFAYAAGLGLDAVENIVPKVLEQLPHIPPDRCRALPKPQPRMDGTDRLAETMVDPTIFTRPLEDQLPRLEAVQAAALKSDRRIEKALRLGYGEAFSEAVVINTLGARLIEGGTHCSLGLAVVGRSGEEVQIGSASSSARHFSDLDFDRAARDAVFRTVSLLDAKKPPTRRRAVVFDPWISGEFMGLVAGALCADQVQRGKSLFRGRMDQKVAAPIVSLVDDPHLPRGIASASFDDEGAPTRRKIMIDRGILKEFFYDAYTANKDSRASNGSAGRASYQGVPGPSSSNFFMEPGKIGRDKLLADTQDGILILEVMGMHMADAVSGEFSVGISGIEINGGKLGRGARGAMLSGNILEILDRIDAVADDLAFYGRIATPTFRVSDMTVA